MLYRTVVVAALTGLGMLAVSALEDSPFVLQSEADSTVQDLCIEATADAGCIELLSGLEHFDTEEKTIYQVLNEQSRFSKLVKLINYDDEVTALLNDTSAGVTFFAVPNSAIPHPRRMHGHVEECDDEEAISGCARAHSDFATLVDVVENFESLADDDEDKERHRAVLRKLLRAVLLYHTLPQGLHAIEISRNVTHATNLTLGDGSLDGQPLRLRIDSGILKRGFTVNLYAKTLRTDIKTKNGVIHAINHPLFPPGSIFQQLFIFPDAFAITTTALQRIGLDGAVEWRYVPGEGDERGSVEGTNSVTFFAPSLKAFNKLPLRLKLFLFSPLGNSVLKKLVQFHVVPNYVFHSDWVHNTTSHATDEINFEPYFGSDEEEWMLDGVGPTSEHCNRHSERPKRFSDFSRCDITREPNPWGHQGRSPSFLLANSAQLDHPKLPKLPKGPHHPVPSFAANLTLPTLLTNTSLHVHIAKFEHKLPFKKEAHVTVVSVNGQRVTLADVPARNGAVHVISSLLNPVKKGKRGPSRRREVNECEEEESDGSWDDWEEWLPQWANGESAD